jgi:DNA ligase D-like protein (predicted 3'-phosphoesterase)
MRQISKRAKVVSDKPAYEKKEKSESGGTIYKYKEDHIKKRWNEKIEKLKKLEKELKKVRKQYEKDLNSDDDRTRAIAAIVGIMDDTAMRIGNEDSAKEGTFGASTLKVKHVKGKGNKMTFDFPGKGAIEQNVVLENSKVIKVIRDLMKGKKSDDFIFEIDGKKIWDRAVNRYLSKFDISAKDLRGFHANRLMKEMLKKKDFKDALNEVAEIVGHEASTLKNQYLDPELVEKHEGKKKKATISCRADDLPMSASPAIQQEEQPIPYSDPTDIQNLLTQVDIDLNVNNIGKNVVFDDPSIKIAWRIIAPFLPPGSTITSVYRDEHEQARILLEYWRSWGVFDGHKWHNRWNTKIYEGYFHKTFGIEQRINPWRIERLYNKSINRTAFSRLDKYILNKISRIMVAGTVPDGFDRPDVAEPGESAHQEGIAFDISGPNLNLISERVIYVSNIFPESIQLMQPPYKEGVANNVVHIVLARSVSMPNINDYVLKLIQIQNPQIARVIQQNIKPLISKRAELTPADIVWVDNLRSGINQPNKQLINISQEDRRILMIPRAKVNQLLLNAWKTLKPFLPETAVMTSGVRTPEDQKNILNHYWKKATGKTIPQDLRSDMRVWRQVSRLLKRHYGYIVGPPETNNPYSHLKGRALDIAGADLYDISAVVKAVSDNPALPVTFRKPLIEQGNGCVHVGVESARFDEDAVLAVREHSRQRFASIYSAIEDEQIQNIFADFLYSNPPEDLINKLGIIQYESFDGQGIADSEDELVLDMGFGKEDGLGNWFEKSLILDLEESAGAAHNIKDPNKIEFEQPEWFKYDPEKPISLRDKNAANNIFPDTDEEALAIQPSTFLNNKKLMEKFPHLILAQATKLSMLHPQEYFVLKYYRRPELKDVNQDALLRLLDFNPSFYFNSGLFLEDEFKHAIDTAAINILKNNPIEILNLAKSSPVIREAIQDIIPEAKKMVADFDKEKELSISEKTKEEHRINKERGQFWRHQFDISEIGNKPSFWEYPKAYISKRLKYANDTINLTSTERKIFNILKSAVDEFNLGTTIRVAGGWVRDKLMGRQSKDIDIAIDNMTGKEFVDYINRYARIHNIDITAGLIPAKPEQGKHLETAVIHMLGESIDVVNLRDEEYDEESRKPIVTITDSPIKDAFRRDLTINSLFYNIHTNKIEDFTGQGIYDIKNKILRTPKTVTEEQQKEVGRLIDAKQIFLDDPLRVLRAIRFANRYPDFKIDPEIISAAKNKDVQEAFRNKITWERRQEELSKIMSENRSPREALELIKDLGYRSEILQLPDEYSEWELDQNNPHHEFNVWGHLMEALDNIYEITKNEDLNKADRYILNWATLLHDVGKLDPTVQGVKEMGDKLVNTYHGHERSSIQAAQYILTKLKGTKGKDIKRVQSLIDAARRVDLDPDKASKITAKAIRNILKLTQEFGDDWKRALQVALADAAAHKGGWLPTFPMEGYDYLTRQFEKVPTTTALVPLISGFDLQNLFNRRPGKWIGQINKELQIWQTQAATHNIELSREDVIHFLESFDAQNIYDEKTHEYKEPIVSMIKEARFISKCAEKESEDGKYEKEKNDPKWDEVLIDKDRKLTRRQIRDHYIKNKSKIMSEIKGKPVMLFIGTGKNQNVLKRNHNDKRIIISDNKDYNYWVDRRVVSIHRVIESKTDLGFVDLDVHGNFSKEKTLKYAKKITSKIKSKYGKPTIYESGGTGYHVEFHTKKTNVDALRNELREMCEDLNEDFDGFTTGIVKGDGVRTDTTTLKTNGNIRVPYALHEKYGGIKKPISHGGDDARDHLSIRDNGKTNKIVASVLYLSGIPDDILELLSHLPGFFPFPSAEEDGIVSGKIIILPNVYILWNYLDKARSHVSEQHGYNASVRLRYIVDEANQSQYITVFEYNSKDPYETFKQLQSFLMDQDLHQKMLKIISDKEGSEQEELAKVIPLFKDKSSSEGTYLLSKCAKKKPIGIFAVLPKSLSKQFSSLGEHDNSVPHITLLYIGKNVKNNQHNLLLQTVERILEKWMPFIVEFDNKVSYFPATKHSDGCKVAKIKILSEQLKKLHKELKKGLVSVGIDVDDHFENYSPHITLEYMEPPKVKYDGKTPEGSWLIDSVEIWGCGKNKTFRLPKVLSKRAKLPYGWWLSPDGQLYEVDVFGHTIFVDEHKELFKDMSGGEYDIAFDNDWIRIVKADNNLDLEFPAKEDKYIRRVQSVDLPGIYKSVEISWPGGYILNIPYSIFVASSGFDDLERFMKYRTSSRWEGTSGAFPIKIPYSMFITSSGFDDMFSSKWASIHSFISKRADTSDAWWLSPDNKLYPVGFFEHARFITENIDLFEGAPEITDKNYYEIYNIAFERGWIRLVTLRGYLQVQVPSFDDLYLKRVQNIVPYLPIINIKKIDILASNDIEVGPFNLLDFLTANSFKDLERLDKQSFKSNFRYISKRAKSISKDPLSVYKKKRNFNETKEPKENGKGKNIFVIQKHEAHRAGTHFDLRLQKDNVLESWAIPKAKLPSKGERLLATITEPHPLSYTGSYTIPSGEYGAGKVSVYQKGHYKPISWSNKKIEFEISSGKAKGKYVLVHTDGKKWLWMIKKDEN